MNATQRFRFVYFGLYRFANSDTAPLLYAALNTGTNSLQGPHHCPPKYRQTFDLSFKTETVSTSPVLLTSFPPNNELSTYLSLSCTGEKMHATTKQTHTCRSQSIVGWKNALPSPQTNANSEVNTRAYKIWFQNESFSTNFPLNSTTLPPSSSANTDYTRHDEVSIMVIVSNSDQLNRVVPHQWIVDLNLLVVGQEYVKPNNQR